MNINLSLFSFPNLLFSNQPTKAQRVSALCRQWKCSKEKLADVFLSHLRKLEKLPVILQGTQEQSEQQYLFYQKWIEQAKWFKKECCKAEQKTLFKLELLRLRYRIGAENGGVDPEESESHFKILKDLLKEWKEQVGRFSPHRMFTKRDKEKLATLSSYSKYTKLLQSNELIRKKIFDRIFCNNIGVEEACFYSLEELERHYMLDKLGATHNRILQMRDEPLNPNQALKGKRRDLTVLCNQTFYSVHDLSQKIQFKHGVEVSLKKVFKHFKNKNNKCGEFESTYDGIELWNAQKSGYLSPEYFSKKKAYKQASFFKQLFLKKPQKTYVQPDYTKPIDEWQIPRFDVTTKEDIEALYQVAVPEETKTLVFRMAARKNPTLDALNSHAFTLIYSRQADGRFLAIPNGYFADEWPVGQCGKANFIADTVQGRLFIPDPNYQCSKRQKGAQLIASTPNQFSQFMQERIRHMKEGVAFGLLWDNCNKSEDDLYRAVYGEESCPIYGPTSFLDCHFEEGVVKKIQDGYRKLTGIIKRVYKWAVLLLMRTKRKFQNKCAHHTPFGQDPDTHIYVPAAMVHRIVNREAPGTYFYGSFAL